MLRQLPLWTALALSLGLPQAHALVDVGYNSHPSFVDIDADGDLDLFIANNDGIVHFYKNTGTATTPILVEQDEQANPLYQQDLGTDVHIRFVDLNNDGLQDLISGDLSGRLRILTNTGTSTNPAFSTDSLNDLLVHVQVDGHANPVFMDLEQDGDLDLFIGTLTGKMVLYRNTGSAVSPSFNLQDEADNPLSGVNVQKFASPDFVDVDNDADLDLFVGNEGGQLVFFENKGSATAASFDTSENLGAAGNVNIIAGNNAMPVLVDIDADGDLDLFSSTDNGVVQFFRNDGDVGQANFQLQNNSVDIFAGINASTQAMPGFFDAGADGDMDVFVSDPLGNMHFIENIGTPLSPVFQENLPANPFAGITFSADTRAHFVDFDADGDLDALLSNSAPFIFPFRNDNGQLVSINSAFSTVNLEGNTPAGFADADNDSDIDILFFDGTGQLRFYENIGSASVAEFAVTDSGTTVADSNVVELSLTSTATDHLSLMDSDNDGDRDLFISSGNGQIRYFINEGLNAGVPSFTEQTGPSNPFPPMTAGQDYQISFTNWTEDNQPDAFIGGTDGLIRYYQNMGNTFQQVTGTGNPLDGVDVGLNNAPTWVDIDNDGLEDLVIGESSGTLKCYQRHRDEQNNLRLSERKDLLNPLAQIPLQANAQPNFADLDQDGDFDLLIAGGNQSLYYENLGNAEHPQYVLQLQAHAAAAPILADIDSDSDVDLLLGGSDGSITLLRNIGSSNKAQFVPVIQALSPFERSNTFTGSVLTLGDLNSDGLQDILMGNEAGSLNLYFNQGTSNQPKWVEVQGADNPFASIDVGTNSKPYLVDLDNNNTLDLVVGESGGKLRYFKNTGTINNPVLTEQGGPADPFALIQSAGFIRPVFEDIDNDQDLDLVFGDDSNGITLIENTGSLSAPLFQAPPAPLLANAGLNNRNMPAFADLDGDSLRDLIIGENNGSVRYFKRSNGANGAEFSAYELPSPVSNGLPFEFVGTGINALALADLDNDENTDIISHDNQGKLSFITQTTGSTAPEPNTTTSRLFAELNLADAANPSIIDLNQDGRFDIISGSSSGEVMILQQEAETQFSQIALVSQTASNNPFAQTRIPKATPNFVDIDQDGDMDTLIGRAEGTLNYYLNTGSPNAALFTTFSTDSLIIELDKPSLDEVNLDRQTLQNLDPNGIQLLPPESFEALNQNTVEIMPADAFTGLSAEQLAAMDEDAIEGLQVSQSQQIPPSSFSGLTEKNIGGFRPEVIQTFSKESVAAMDGERIRQAKGRDLSKVITNLSPEQVSPADVKNILPTDWSIDETTGELKVPAGTSIQLKAKQPKNTNDKVRIPENIPDLATQFGLGGGQDNASTVLDSMNAALQDNELGNSFSQNDSGIVQLDGKFAFLPDFRAMRQGDSDATREFKQNRDGSFTVVTDDLQEIPLIPAPKDPVAAQSVLSRYGNIEFDMRDAGDVILSLKADGTRRAGTSRYVVSFDSSVETVPEDTEAGISTDSSGNLILIYEDGTSQQVYSTVIDPDQFIELALAISGVENIVYNNDGTFSLVFSGANYLLTTQTNIVSTTLADGVSISPYITTTSSGMIQYTIQEGQEQIDMFLVISAV